MDTQLQLDDSLFDETHDLTQTNLDHILPATDHTVLQANNVVVPTAPGLTARLLDQVYSGCPNKLAWSRGGLLASLTDDGTTVALHCLRLAPTTGRWKLYQVKALENTFEGASTLLWSGSGMDLAIVDSKGRTSVFICTTSMNRLHEFRSIATDLPDVFGGAIGAYWFNQDRPERPRVVVLNATRNGDRWAQSIAKCKSYDPFWPRAFSSVNRQGTMTTIYWKPDGTNSKVVTALSTSSTSLYTHAAIAANTDGRLLVALYSCVGCLSVHAVRTSLPINMDFSQPVNFGTEVVDNNVPIHYSHHAEGVMPSPVDNSGLVLTHLTIVPASDVENSHQLPPTIWAVFASISQNINANNSGSSEQSVLKRWSVVSVTRKLLPRFDDMPTKAGNAGTSAQSWAVDRLADTQFPNLITAVELVDNGQMVAITTSDGRTDLWDPVTMSPASFEPNTDKVSSLSQAGFSFHRSTSAILSVVSSDTCMTATADIDDKITHNDAAYLGQAKQNLNLSDPQQNAAATALSVTFYRACYSNSNIDDVLACMSTTYHAASHPSLLSHLYRTQFRDTEFVHEKLPNSELDKLAIKPLVLKLLSAHMALLAHPAKLSSDGEPPKVLWSRMWAWISINVRNFNFVFHHFMKEVGSSSPHLGSASIGMMCNNIRWILDLYRFIVSSILEIGDRATNSNLFDTPSATACLGDSNGDGTQGLIALLINCNWSRAFLLASAKGLRSFALQATPSSPVASRLVQAITEGSTDKGLSLTTMDRLLDGKWYIQNGLHEGESPKNYPLITQRQVEMMTTGDVSATFQGTIRRLLDNVVNADGGLKSRGEINRLKLFRERHDLSWLFLNMNSHIPFLSSSPSMNGKSHSAIGINNVFSTRNVKSNTGRVVDVHKKCYIFSSNSNLLIRRCARCGSVTEDLENSKREWPKTLYNYFNKCVCDGSWILEEIDNEIDSLEDDELEDEAILGVTDTDVNMG